MTIQTNLNKAIKLAADMLKKMDNADGKWTATDDKKLAQLNKLVSVLAKLMPLEEKGIKKKRGSAVGDRKIINEFIIRNKKK